MNQVLNFMLKVMCVNEVPPFLNFSSYSRKQVSVLELVFLST